MPRHPLLLLALVALAPPAAAQETPDEQARRLLEDGRAYRAQGKPKQALDNFNIVVSSFPSTDSVGQALLEIGRYRMEVEGDAEKARAAFEQVTKQYARSDAAPGAYYNLGLLTLQRATTAAEIDDALAQFARVETLYPRSPWVPRSLAGLGPRPPPGRPLRGGRRPQPARLARVPRLRRGRRRPVRDRPGPRPPGPAAPRDGGVPAGPQPLPAEPLGRSPRSSARPPSIASSAGRSPSSRRTRRSPSRAGDVLKDVRALAVAPGGTLWIASDKSRSAVPFDASGKAGPSLTAEDPRALSLDPGRRGGPRRARRGARRGRRTSGRFTTPPEKAGRGAEARGQDPRRRGHARRVASSCPTRSARRSCATTRRASTSAPSRAKDAAKRKVTRIVVDGEGGIVTLDREEKAVRVWDETGRLLRAVGPAGLKRPVDVAVDAFRNLYVADEELGVLVFNPQGQPLATIASPELQRPRALALDATGAVLVYDDRAERVLRYR